MSVICLTSAFDLPITTTSIISGSRCSPTCSIEYSSAGSTTSYTTVTETWSPNHVGSTDPALSGFDAVTAWCDLCDAASTKVALTSSAATPESVVLTGLLPNHPSGTYSHTDDITVQTALTTTSTAVVIAATSPHGFTHCHTEMTACSAYDTLPYPSPIKNAFSAPPYTLANATATETVCSEASGTRICFVGKAINDPSAKPTPGLELMGQNENPASMHRNSVIVALLAIAAVALLLI
ncbi:hypothetical protein LTR66_005981 [Elasticomyces elasticus]|nr:hypothetical protein LTR66_005981 [Elasticomyces elasticus]